jgi:ribosomal protein L37AE/L43A
MSEAREDMQVVQCDQCDRGTVHRSNGRILRCAFCRGTGQILVPVKDAKEWRDSVTNRQIDKPHGG